MKVKDIMTQSVITVPEGTTLQSALSMMIDQGKSCLAVTCGQKPVGIITERDITRVFSSFLAEGKIKTLSVNDFMTPNPICVSADVDFKEALVLSRSRRLRHLLVVNDDEALAGLVTQTNLVDAFAMQIEHQDELESSLEELRLLSFEDPLLKIGNRRAMEVDLSFTEAEAKRHNKTYAVVLFDIDSFKKYNDHYGHQSGDEVLYQVAQGIKQSLRDSDRVFRYGGEEILVLMPETDSEAALNGAERTRSAVENLGLPHVKSDFGVVTVSGGVTSSMGGEWHAMVEEADRALYQAKNSGRNRVVLSG